MRRFQCPQLVRIWQNFHLIPSQLHLISSRALFLPQEMFSMVREKNYVPELCKKLWVHYEVLCLKWILNRNIFTVLYYLLKKILYNILILSLILYLNIVYLFIFLFLYLHWCMFLRIHKIHIYFNCACIQKKKGSIVVSSCIKQNLRRKKKKRIRKRKNTF